MAARDTLERRVGLGQSQLRPATPKVLVALDDPVLAGRISSGLAAEGLVPVLAFSFEQALDRIEEEPYSLLVLSRLGISSGMIRAIARAAPSPIVTYGPGDEPQLGTTVEDHLDPAASLDELVARCVAVVRISRPVYLPTTLRWGPLELDPARKSATWRGHHLKLTVIQFRVMELLVLAVGSVVTTAELSRHIWGPHTHEDNERIFAHVRRIRQRIESEPSRPRFLLTVRGEGFRLADHEIEEPTVTLV
jgi:DNA-binding response OmpR family regulator